VQLDSEDVTVIASAIMEKLKPLLPRNLNREAEDALMTIEETAKFLRTSKGQIYQWVNNSQHGLGTFPYHKAGKLLRFSKTEILKWMKTNSKRLEER
jgi:excisionase family DNA binding protein